MTSNDNQNQKKPFRPTAARFQNSVKILAGTKTNATIRDLDEEEDELEEIEGTVVSIERNKINGDGWTVKGDNGETYQCHVASNMYEVPETVEKGGILYPTSSIRVKVSISPTLRRNTITEFTNLGEDESTVDIGKFSHKDEATTVIAKPMSAISVSNSIIKFNYNNTNQVTADKDGVDINGNQTNINTDSVNINSNDIKINGTSINELIEKQTEDTKKTSTTNTYTPLYKKEITTDIFLDKNNNLAQLVINNLSLKISEKERVIMDILNQEMYSLRKQVFNRNNITLSVYPNGIITIKSDEEKTIELSDSFNWLAPSSELRNCLVVENPYQCDMCKNQTNQSTSVFLDYCPVCGWGYLTGFGSHIACTSCGIIFCGTCGNVLDSNGTNFTASLKKATNNQIKATESRCSKCKNVNDKLGTKKYANYCPQCKSWGFLENQNDNTNIIKCLRCDHTYCTSCGVDIEGEIIETYIGNNIYNLGETNNNYPNKYNRQKLFFINKESN